MNTDLRHREPGIHTAHVHCQAGALLKTPDHTHRIRNPHFLELLGDLILPILRVDFGVRDDPLHFMRKPTLDHFEVDPQLQHVAPAHVHILPPMHRTVGIHVHA
ncbi:MAG: hypothetical protein BWY82_00241 [Verrucomicrobia bacterium ADurb.Bin474]|nr:MAG: hypothetical protein BWY82_00241 [Verrucomicrobia bacterium ADurb.Bin474]